MRSGDYIDIGDNSSALLQLPSAIEKKIPADADHPGLVKFKSNGNSRYQDVQSAVQQLLNDAPQVLKKRFGW